MTGEIKKCDLGGLFWTVWINPDSEGAPKEERDLAYQQSRIVWGWRGELMTRPQAKTAK